MATLQNKIRNYLIKINPYHWRVILPFIIPDYIASDIEQILETKKSLGKFKLEINFLNEFPMSIDEYYAHEQSMHYVFSRLMIRSFKLKLFTISGMSHYKIFEARKNHGDTGYDYFTPDNFIKWESFLDDPIIIDRNLFYSAHITYRGIAPSGVSFVMSEDMFVDLSNEIQGAHYEYVHKISGNTKELSSYMVQVPLGSIIHMILQP